MRAHLTTAAIMLAAVPALAQTTGVSQPDPVVIEATPAETVTVKVAPAKPRAGIPVAAALAAPAASGVVYGPYVPYAGAVTTPAQAVPAQSSDPDANIVLSVPDVPGELRTGTLLHVRMREQLSTLTTTPGAPFSADLTEPVEKDGRVVLPVGAVLKGRVTEVHSGRRISGRAMLHLDPRRVELPDGSFYDLRAQLIDTDQTGRNKIDSEGSLVRRDHPKEMLAILGGTTGAGAVAGALVGGGVGAAVGAGIGAGASTIVWLKQDRQTELPENAGLVFTLTEPMLIQPEGASGRTGALRQHEPAASPAELR